MHGVDEVPVLVAHLVEDTITQNACIIDQNVDAAKGVNGRLDDLVAVLYRVVVGHGCAASLADLIDNDVSRLGRRALA